MDSDRLTRGLTLGANVGVLILPGSPMAPVKAVVCDNCAHE